MAAEPGMAAALRLSPAVFYRPAEDPEEGRRRPEICLGQTGTDGGGKIASRAARVGEGPLISFPARLITDRRLQEPPCPSKPSLNLFASRALNRFAGRPARSASSYCAQL